MQKAVFVSILKPVDDIRLFHKIAQAWKDANYEIHSIGFEASVQNDSNIFFYPIFKFKRLNIKRLFAGCLVFYYLLKIRPQHIVCGSIEALPFCIFFKIYTFGKTKVFYDVQENYHLNILHTRVYPTIFRYPLAWTIRSVEWLCSFFITYFFLAEECYAKELNFLGKRYVILENKPLQKFFQESIPSPAIVRKFALVGTIAEEYGIWKALSVFDKIQLYEPNSQLLVHGKCAKKEVYEKLKNLQDRHVVCKISEKPLPYENIVETMKIADAILMPYEINKSYEKRIPTKFYEAMALNRWIIVSDNSSWQKFFIKMNYLKVFFLDFDSLDIALDLYELSEVTSQHSEYQNYIIQEDLFWEHEQKKLSQVVPF
jgi:glycosyltransferase involved in cell wall biosynthesis